MSHSHDAHDPHSAHGPANADDHHDPLHDIDGPKTVFAVLGTLGLVVVLIWAMSHLYNVMVQVERQEKIGNVPAEELEAMRKVEHDELDGRNPNRGKMSIDQAIAEYIKAK